MSEPQRKKVEIPDHVTDAINTVVAFAIDTIEALNAGTMVTFPSANGQFAVQVAAGKVAVAAMMANEMFVYNLERTFLSMHEQSGAQGEEETKESTMSLVKDDSEQ